jgi:hypothetical protein
MSHAMSYLIVALGIEALLLLLLFLSVSWFRNRAMRRRDARAAKDLVARVRQRAGDREEAIARFLEQGVGLSGTALDHARSQLLGAERTVLQRFADSCRQRAASAAERFDQDLMALLDHYHALSTTGAPSATDCVGDQRQLEALREENRRLSEELQVGMETMSRMLKEYSTMFAAASAPELAPAAHDGEDGVSDAPDGQGPAVSEGITADRPEGGASNGVVPGETGDAEIPGAAMHQPAAIGGPDPDDAPASPHGEGPVHRGAALDDGDVEVVSPDDAPGEAPADAQPTQQAGLIDDEELASIRSAP